MTERFKVATAAAAYITRPDHQVLLIKHRASGWWLMPGGRGEENESPRVTCEREVTEEIGVPGIAKELLTTSYLTPRAALTDHPPAGAYPCVLLTFNVELLSPNAPFAIAEREITDWAWWDVAEVTAEVGKLVDPYNAQNLIRAHAVHQGRLRTEFLEW